MATTTTLGNDILAGTAGPEAIYGDAADSLAGSAKGGNDQIFALGGSDTVYGDANVLYGSAKGGNDQIHGGGSSDRLVGDALEMWDTTKGGNDQIFSAGGSTLLGDAFYMAGSAKGGNDELWDGGAGGSSLVGDATYMFGNTQGGNDVLHGAGAGSTLIGDAYFAGGEGGAVVGGGDRLVSGPGDDLMVGDFFTFGNNVTGGRDTFVFDGAFGDDTVRDFRQGEDRIEFGGNGVTGLAGLQIATDTAHNSTDITVAGYGTVHLDNFSGALTAKDFVFA